jgi:hypothetical protein
VRRVRDEIFDPEATVDGCSTGLNFGECGSGEELRLSILPGGFASLKFGIGARAGADGWE